MPKCRFLHFQHSNVRLNAENAELNAEMPKSAEVAASSGGRRRRTAAATRVGGGGGGFCFQQHQKVWEHLTRHEGNMSLAPQAPEFLNPDP
eukprot:gene10800-biopygen12353